MADNTKIEWADASAEGQMTKRTLRPFAEWHEDHGNVLWWHFPICEPPYVGGPLDIGFNVSATLHNQFGDVVGTTSGDVGGWPWATDVNPDLFWEPLTIPERPDHG